MVRWLRLHSPNAGGLGPIPGPGTRSCMMQLNSSNTAMKIEVHMFVKTGLFKKQNQDRTTWSPSLCFSSKPSLANPRPSLPSVPQSQREKCPMLSPAVPLLILSLHTSGCHLPLPLCVVILPCASVPYTKNTFNFLFPKKKEKFHSKLC